MINHRNKMIYDMDIYMINNINIMIYDMEVLHDKSHKHNDT